MNIPSRGGAKPSMLAVGSRELSLSLGDQKKFGLYQLSPNGRILARMVELPTWLSDVADRCKLERKSLLSELQSGKIGNPNHEIGESHGHILIDAKLYTSFTLPAVGIDAQILDQLSGNPPAQVLFHVYRTGYRIHEKWGISWDKFSEASKRIEANPPFMPQYMVCVTDLELRPF